MPSNNSIYTEDMRERTAKFIIESKKSATSVAEEMGIDTNTVCRWFGINLQDLENANWRSSLLVFPLGALFRER